MVTVPDPLPVCVVVVVAEGVTDAVNDTLDVTLMVGVREGVTLLEGVFVTDAVRVGVLLKDMEDVGDSDAEGELLAVGEGVGVVVGVVVAVRDQDFVGVRDGVTDFELVTDTVTEMLEVNDIVGDVEGVTLCEGSAEPVEDGDVVTLPLKLLLPVRESEALGVCVTVDVEVRESVAVLVTVGVAEKVGVGVLDRVAEVDLVPVLVLVRERVGVPVRDGVRVLVDVNDTDGVADAVGVTEDEDVGVADGEDDGVGEFERVRDPVADLDREVDDDLVGVFVRDGVLDGVREDVADCDAGEGLKVTLALSLTVSEAVGDSKPVPPQTCICSTNAHSTTPANARRMGEARVTAYGATFWPPLAGE